MLPQRIQRKRIKGWKMPENTISVTRPGKWGNPFRVGDFIKLGTGQEVGFSWLRTSASYATKDYRELKNAQDAVDAYEELLKIYPPKDIAELTGKNLACFCSLDSPCHADVLLKLANQ